jgi:tripartite-type tricarboxylate transporter receptor subunit TctC
MPLRLGLAGPKGIPKRILKQIEAAFTAAFHDPFFNDTLDKLIMTPVYRNSDSFRELVLKNFERGRELVEAAGMLKR